MPRSTELSCGLYQGGGGTGLLHIGSELLVQHAVTPPPPPPPAIYSNFTSRALSYVSYVGADNSKNHISYDVSGLQIKYDDVLWL